MTLARRMFLASVVLALVVGAAFAALMVAVSAQRDATKRETRSQRGDRGGASTEKLVVDMETGVRGFVLTGERRLLRGVHEGEREMPARSSLQALVGGRPRAAETGGKLVNETRQYLEFADRTLVKARREEPAWPNDPSSRDEGKQYTDEIRTSIDSFLREENRLAMAASADADRQRADIALIVGASGSPPRPR